MQGLGVRLGLESFFSQQPVVKWQKEANVTALNKLGQIQNDFDDLRHVAVLQSQLQVANDLVLLPLVQLGPDADEASVEQIRRR